MNRQKLIIERRLQLVPLVIYKKYIFDGEIHIRYMLEDQLPKMFPDASDEELSIYLDYGSLYLMRNEEQIVKRINEFERRGFIYGNYEPHTGLQ